MSQRVSVDLSAIMTPADELSLSNDQGSDGDVAMFRGESCLLEC